MKILFQKPSNIKFIIAQEDRLKASLTLRRAASCSNVHFVFSNIVKNFESQGFINNFILFSAKRSNNILIPREERD
jgi:hypothetical protein